MLKKLPAWFEWPHRSDFQVALCHSQRGKSEVWVTVDSTGGCYVEAHLRIFECLHIIIAKGGRQCDGQEVHPADPHTIAGRNSAADCGNVFQRFRQLWETFLIV